MELNWGGQGGLYDRVREKKKSKFNKVELDFFLRAGLYDPILTPLLIKKKVRKKPWKKRPGKSPEKALISGGTKSTKNRPSKKPFKYFDMLDVHQCLAEAQLQFWDWL